MRNIDLYVKVNDFIELADELSDVKFFDPAIKVNDLEKLKELLFDNSNLYFESKDAFDKLARSEINYHYYKYLIKNNVGGGPEINFTDFSKIDNQSYIEIAKANHIQSKKNFFINEKCGFFIFLKTDWKNEDKIPALSLEKYINVIYNSIYNEFDSWNNLFREIPLSSNSMVIMDLYVWND